MSEAPQQWKWYPDWFVGSSRRKPRGVCRRLRAGLDELIALGPRSWIRNRILWPLWWWRRLRWRGANRADGDVGELTSQRPAEFPYGSFGVTWCSLYLVFSGIEGRVELTPDFIREATRGATPFEDTELVLGKVIRFVQVVAPEKYGRASSFLACWYEEPKFVLWEWRERDGQMTIQAVTPWRWRWMQFRQWREGWRRIPRPDDWYKTTDVG